MLPAMPAQWSLLSATTLPSPSFMPPTWFWLPVTTRPLPKLPSPPVARPNRLPTTMFPLPLTASPSPLLSEIRLLLTTFWLPLIRTPVLWFHPNAAPAASVPIWSPARLFPFPATWIPTAALTPDESWTVKPSIELLLVLSATPHAVLTVSMTTPPPWSSTGCVITGRLKAGVIVFPPAAGRLKSITLRFAFAFAELIAARSVPAPALAVLVTVCACAAPAVAPSPMSAAASILLIMGLPFFGWGRRGRPGVRRGGWPRRPAPHRARPPRASAHTASAAAAGPRAAPPRRHRTAPRPAPARA